MGRGFLMALLALDLLVMGASGYVIWDRVNKSFLPPPRSILPAPAPTPAAQTWREAPPSSVRPPSETKPELNEESPEEENQAAPKIKIKTKPGSPVEASGAPRKILFQYRDPFAKRVSIVGDFNRWAPKLMNKDGARWSISLSIKPGVYAYNFLVDGKTIRDPSQKQSKKRAGQKIPASLIDVKPKT